jgi:acetyltransferase-like isoleucine patch superfamily enzyme
MTDTQITGAAALDILRTHPALQNSTTIGTEGYSLPDFAEGAKDILLTAETVPLLASLGVKVSGAFGPGNRLLVGPGLGRNAVELTCRKEPQNNLLVIEGGRQFRARIGLEREGNLFCAAASSFAHALKVTFRGGTSMFFAGKDGATSTYVNCVVEGPGRQLVIGDEYMFSIGVDLRTTDSHSIIDLKAGTVLNAPEDLVIGPHVWVATDALIMKGLEIGRGSIIAARSTVTKSVPNCSLVAGSPARVLRGDVTWSKASRPSDRVLAELVSRFGEGE